MIMFSQKNDQLDLNNHSAKNGAVLTEAKNTRKKGIKYEKVVYKVLNTSNNSLKKIQSLKCNSTTTSTGGYLMSCRFIIGPLGAYRCACWDPRLCYKDHNAAILELTPRCFSYNDRFVLEVKRACGISDQLKQFFPEISDLPTNTVLELGKKENKGVSRFISEVLA